MPRSPHAMAQVPMAVSNSVKPWSCRFFPEIRCKVTSFGFMTQGRALDGSLARGFIPCPPRTSLLARDQSMTDRISLLEDLIAKAKRLGAEAADAVVFDSVSSSVSYRLGKLEEVERSESQRSGLARVHRQAAGGGCFDRFVGARARPVGGARGRDGAHDAGRSLLRAGAARVAGEDVADARS